MRTSIAFTATIIFAAVGTLIPVLAADAGSPTRANQTTVAAAQLQRSSEVEAKLVAQFTTFAGSEDNARSLVTGLRTGTAVTLSDESAAGTLPPRALTFDVPTKPMGYGNVSISLALARQQLANLGVTEPTPEELRAALVGGTVTSGTDINAAELRGILTLRSEGMGWGNVAKSQGVNLGQVVSALKSGGHSIVARDASATASMRSGAARQIHNKTSTIWATSAEPGVMRASPADIRVHGSSGPGANGIVTGTGTAIGSKGNYYGSFPTSGMVRADGSTVGLGAVHGNGLAKGRGK